MQHSGMSSVLETALIAKLVQDENEKWQERNKLAVIAYNEMVDDKGCLSDAFREF